MLLTESLYILLKVRNGSDTNSPLLGKYCGNTLPNPIFPKNHVIYLHFKSDHLLSHEGYEITWTSSSAGTNNVLSSVNQTINKLTHQPIWLPLRLVGAAYKLSTNHKQLAIII